MKLSLVLATLMLATLGAATPAAAQDPGACVGSACPPGYLACVTGVDPRLDFCVVEPVIHCYPIQYFDETVGPVRATAGGCGAQVWAFGRPLLP
jgi:hypothetical protein